MLEIVQILKRSKIPSLLLMITRLFLFQICLLDTKYFRMVGFLLYSRDLQSRAVNDRWEISITLRIRGGAIAKSAATG